MGRMFLVVLVGVVLGIGIFSLLFEVFFGLRNAIIDNRFAEITFYFYTTFLYLSAYLGISMLFAYLGKEERSDLFRVISRVVMFILNKLNYSLNIFALYAFQILIIGGITVSFLVAIKYMNLAAGVGLFDGKGVGATFAGTSLAFIALCSSLEFVRQKAVAEFSNYLKQKKTEQGK